MPTARATKKPDLMLQLQCGTRPQLQPLLQKSLTP